MHDSSDNIDIRKSLQSSVGLYKNTTDGRPAFHVLVRHFNRLSETELDGLVEMLVSPTTNATSDKVPSEVQLRIFAYSCCERDYCDNDGVYGHDEDPPVQNLLRVCKRWKELICDNEVSHSAWHMIRLLTT